MNYSVNGHTTYCYTGGKAFDAAKPTVVFIHGVLNDHSVWILQSRWFANHGWNVLALDLPGHCRSEGAPPATVEEAAAFVIALLDAAGVARAALVGHSFGSLIALEVAARAPRRVTHLALVGTAYPMAVSDALLDASQNDPQRAIDMVNAFSHSLLAPPPSALGPGTWLYGTSRAPDAPRAREQSRGERLPHRFQGLRQLRQRRGCHGGGAGARYCSCSARPTR